MHASRFRGFGSTGKEDAGGGRDIWSTPGLDHNLRMSRLMSDRGTRVPDDVRAAPRSMTLILRSPAGRASPPRTLADSTAHYDSPVTRAVSHSDNFSSESFRRGLRRSFYE